jgi:general secretion pathway protein J
LPIARDARAGGFTLVELLVALMIFALLSGAGVVLLRGSIDTQRAVRSRLDALADVQRAAATLESDLAQTVARVGRTEAGTYAPAFFGRAAQSDAALMEFVRGGWSNPSGQRHPSLQRIAYWWRAGRLERVAYAALDGAAPSEPAVLFEAVIALALRYRDADGVWRDQWFPEHPEDMPVAVEIVVTRADEAPLTLRFLLGPQTAPGPNRDPGENAEAGEGIGNGV